MSRQRDAGRILILGGGPTGYGAAWRLQELGYEDFTVLEAAESPGGLASSVVDDAGFTWDQGGHVQFSHYLYYDKVLDEAVPEGWFRHARQAWVWIDGHFVPYPYQYNIHYLDAAESHRMLEGLRLARSSARDSHGPRHFADWIVRTYGLPMAEHFLLPYNLKAWGYPLDEMGWSWVGERVAVPDLEVIERNMAEKRDETRWGPNQMFRYPKKGGTGSIWKGVAALLDPNRSWFGTRVVSIDCRSRTVQLAGGESVAYDTLITTIPLDRLVQMSDPMPAEAQTAARLLRHSSVHILGIGLMGGRPKSLEAKCWMYFPQANSPYHRVTVFSNYSPDLVPSGDGAWSLMAEVCESPHRSIDVVRLKETALAALRTDGLITQDSQILSFWHRRLEHGYPTPTVNRDEILEILHPLLEKECMYSRGRFGGWKYEVSNQDHSFMQGVELVDRLVHGEPETTYFDPCRPNSGEFSG